MDVSITNEYETIARLGLNPIMVSGRQRITVTVPLDCAKKLVSDQKYRGEEIYGGVLYQHGVDPKRIPISDVMVSRFGRSHISYSGFVVPEPAANYDCSINEFR